MKKLKIVFTHNDIYRIFGVILVIAGYFVNTEKPFEANFNGFSFKGEAIAVVGLILIFIPIFLRGKNVK